MSQVYGKMFKSGKLSRSHQKVIYLVGSGTSVLELGASTGYLTQKFKLAKNTVDIIEQDNEDAKTAKQFADKVFVGSLDDDKFLKTLKAKYDVVVAADVLEHLKYPEQALEFIKSRLKSGGRLITSVPNVASWDMRKNLFFKGQFEYQESGLLDKTHLKFYTFWSFQKLLEDNGFKIVNVFPIESSYPLKNLILKNGRTPGRLLDFVFSKISFKLFPNLTVFHFVVECKLNG